MVLGRLEDWSREGWHQPTNRASDQLLAMVHTKTPKKSDAALALGVLFVLLLSGVVSIVSCLREDGTAGGGDGGSDAPAAWRLDPVPLMIVGDTDADPLYEVAGVAITENRVVIAQQSSGTLRFYDHDGSLVAEVGGRGEGPGEFGGLDWMRRSGDHLFAYDAFGREISRYDLNGRLLGSFSLQNEEPGVSTVGVFSDGSVLVDAWELYWATKPIVERVPVRLLLFDGTGGFVHHLLEMAGSELWYEPVGTTGMRQMLRLFGRITHAAVVDSLFVVVENDSYDIPVYGSDGVARDTLRPAIVPDPTPLRPEEAEFARRILLDSQDLGSSRAVVEGMLDAMGLPEHLPPYGRLSLSTPNHHPVTAADGLVWALRYGGLPRERADDEGLEWYVLRPGTGQIATLSSPDDVALVDVAGDLAAVLRRTELDEEIVELRRIVGR